jgi:hypothetical protein
MADVGSIVKGYEKLCGMFRQAATRQEREPR